MNSTSVEFSVNPSCKDGATDTEIPRGAARTPWPAMPNTVDKGAHESERSGLATEKGSPMTSPIPRLVCFPHAGAGSFTYSSWRAVLASRFEMHGIELPGRMSRASEPLASTMADLLAAVEERVDAAAQPPYLLYGHSLGALLAFESARRLCAAGRPPTLLVVSGRNGPTWSSPYPTIHDLPDEQFLDAVSAMDASMSALRDEPDLARLFLPVLRADLTIAESHRYHDAGLLPCPILSVQGEQDPLVSSPGVAAWAGETTARCLTRWMPGEHFFHLRSGHFVAELPQLITEALS